MNPTNLYKIGELAQKSGLSVETLRFYESKGLLQPVQRTSSGYRLYDAQAFKRIQFISHTKDLGFSLKEILEFLELKQAGGEHCHEVRQQVVEKINEVEEKIKQLQQVKESLALLTEVCSGEDSIALCPILHHFENCTRECLHD